MRWTLGRDEQYGERVMVLDPAGEWVKFDDYKKLIDILKHVRCDADLYNCWGDRIINGAVKCELEEETCEEIVAHTDTWRKHEG